MKPTRAQAARYRDQVRGTLLGGAGWDSLGYPVEFAALPEIRARHGSAGVRAYVDAGSGAYGLVSDDTQMTLFTVDGLIRAGVRRDRGLGFTASVVHRAY